MPPTLAQKLGLKPGMKILLVAAPPDFVGQLGTLPPGAGLVSRAAGPLPAAIAFVRTQADVGAIAPGVLDALAPDALLWFAYPKKTGPLASDLSRGHGWEPVSARGYDSVAQISIDDTWTGFRFRPKHLIGKRAK
jgi:hypothetical protein